MNTKSNSKFRQLLDYVLPSYARLPLLILIIVNCSTYWGSRFIAHNWKHYDLSLPIDSTFPLWSWTITIYLGCYIFWISNYIISCRFGATQAYRFVSAEIMAKLVCFLFYLFLPTTMNRPTIEATSFFDHALLLLYQADAADNLFPSIHCLVSWFCFMGVRRNDKIPTWYKFVSLVLALTVCVSTLTTKQHVLVDTFAGVGLAELCYFITGRYFKNHEVTPKEKVKKLAS